MEGHKAIFNGEEKDFYALRIKHMTWDECAPAQHVSYAFVAMKQKGHWLLWMICDFLQVEHESNPL